MIALETVRGRFPNHPRTAATGIRLQVVGFMPSPSLRASVQAVLTSSHTSFPSKRESSDGRRRRPVGDSRLVLLALAFTRTRVALCTIGCHKNANLYIRNPSASSVSVDLQGCRTPWRASRAAPYRRTRSYGLLRSPWAGTGTSKDREALHWRISCSLSCRI
jgi:hypothetical protein